MVGLIEDSEEMSWSPINKRLQCEGRVGDGTPLQDSCLENLMDGGAWWAAVHVVEKS